MEFSSIDISQPLWKDLLSTITSFLGKGSLLAFLLVSNDMNKYIKNHAIFQEMEEYSEGTALNKFKTFFFAHVEVFRLDLEGLSLEKSSQLLRTDGVPNHPLFRQRFLERVTFHTKFDLRYLCLKNKNGNYIFPNLKSVGIRAGTIEENHLVDFLSERNIIHVHTDSVKNTMTESSMKQIVNDCQFKKIAVTQDRMMQIHDYELVNLENLFVKAIGFPFAKSGTNVSEFNKVFRKVLEVFGKNENIEKITLYSSTLEVFKEKFLKDGRFISVKTLKIKTTEVLHEEHLEKMKGIFEKISLEEVVFSFKTGFLFNKSSPFERFLKFCLGLVKYREKGMNIQFLHFDKLKTVETMSLDEELLEELKKKKVSKMFSKCNFPY